MTKEDKNRKGKLINIYLHYVNKAPFEATLLNISTIYCRFFFVTPSVAQIG
jgi:hypothetical protein